MRSQYEGKLETSDFPLGSAQESIWFLSQFQPKSAFYNTFSVWDIRGNLSIESLSEALNILRARHESLRTRIVTVSGFPRQRVDAYCPIKLEIIDGQGIPPVYLDDLIAAEVDRTFDLSSQHPFRALLLRERHRYVLILTVHHIAVDVWSQRIVLRELGESYQRVAMGYSVSLIPADFQNRDHVRREGEMMASKQFAGKLSRWRSTLGTPPEPSELLGSLNRPTALTYKSAVVPFEISTSLCIRVADLQRELACSRFMFFIALFAILLCRCSGRNEAWIGYSAANRSGLGADQIVGCLINSLVLRVSVDDKTSFREVVRNVCNQVLESIESQEVPFNLLVRELLATRFANRNPLFQVMFEDLAGIPPNLELSGTVVKKIAFAPKYSRMDMTLAILSASKQIKGLWIYNVDIFSDSTVVAMSAQLVSLLECCLSDPDYAGILRMVI